MSEVTPGDDGEVTSKTRGGRTGGLARSRLIRLARFLVLGYLALVMLVAAFQNALLYFPARDSEAALLAHARQQQLEPWRDAGGQLIGWRRPNPQAAARLLVFHGNAGYGLHRRYYADSFGALDAGRRWEVLLFEYPGYGARPGSLGRKSFIEAGRAAVEELRAADSRPLFLLGESIGSGVACELAGALPDRIAGVVAVVPFARLVDVARAHFPFLPVRLLLRDKFDNPAALTGYRGPLVVVVAKEDEIVGAAEGLALHEAYTGPKRLIELAGAGHNSFPAEPDAAWFREVSEFLHP